jgi:hypothetical protein
VYQQPLKSLKAFRPKVIAKSPDESGQILAALRRNFVFSGMDGRAVAPLVDAFELCGFDAGDTIIRQGEPGACERATCVRKRRRRPVETGCWFEFGPFLTPASRIVLQVITST